jgi:hypothetical protein
MVGYPPLDRCPTTFMWLPRGLLTSGSDGENRAARAWERGGVRRCCSWYWSSCRGSDTDKTFRESIIPRNRVPPFFTPPSSMDLLGPFHTNPRTEGWNLDGVDHHRSLGSRAITRIVRALTTRNAFLAFSRPLVGSARQ